MTPTATAPSSRFEQYEHQGRALADEQGQPVPRLQYPAVPSPTLGRFQVPDGADLRPVTWTLVTANGPLRAYDLDQGTVPTLLPAVDPLSIQERLLPMREENATNEGPPVVAARGGVLVLIDDAALSRLQSASDGKAPGLERALALCTSLPISSRVVVLTRALAAKFHLPTGYDSGDLGSWAAAFGLANPRSLENIPWLLRQVYSGHRLAQFPPRNPDADAALSQIAEAETALLLYLGGTSIQAEVGRFNTITALSAWSEYALAADPLGREQARQNGTVFHLVPAPRKGLGWFQVEGSMATRVGKSVVMLAADRRPDPRDRSGVATIVAINAAPDGGFLVLLKGGRLSAAALGRTNGSDFMEAPFLGGITPSIQGRWFARAGGEEDPVSAVRRDVPTWLVEAGAPLAPSAAA